MLKYFLSFFKKRKYLFANHRDSLFVYVDKDIVFIEGKKWISSTHMDIFKTLEEECIKNKIFSIDLSKANITSRLVSKLENIHNTSGKKITLFITKDQEVLVSYLTINYRIDIIFV